MIMCAKKNTRSKPGPIICKHRWMLVCHDAARTCVSQHVRVTNMASSAGSKARALWFYRELSAQQRGGTLYGVLGPMCSICTQSDVCGVAEPLSVAQPVRTFAVWLCKLPMAFLSPHTLIPHRSPKAKWDPARRLLVRTQTTSLCFPHATVT